MSEAPKLRVAVSLTFMEAFARIPARQQGKVAKFMQNFRENPRGQSFNYEKIRNASDPNMRSVRIDQTYRGIVLQPESGDVYLLLWVDHHDEAYEWAERKVVNVNPQTGSIQVYTVDESLAPEAEREQPVAEQRTDLFAAHRDREILRLGVPKPLLPVIRNIHSEQDLDAASGHLPAEATEALYMLAAGDSLAEVVNAVEAAQEEAQVDPEDFVTALDNVQSQRRFIVVEDQEQLQEILNAPLELWRVFLHPSQRKLVEKANFNGPARVLGGAGTGKTVVAMHRAKMLAEKIFTAETDRILVTTFTKNLAEDIRENMRTFCSVEAMRRIDIVNLDSWVSNYLRGRKWEFGLVFDADKSDLWQSALLLAPDSVDYPDTFYRDEWTHVIQAKGVRTLADYFKVKRIGRGRPLSRAGKKAIWPVFEEYRAGLTRRNQKEFVDALRDAASMLDNEALPAPYRAVVVDESQDMSQPAFELIRRLVAEGANDLFIVGDAHQRIYGSKVVLSHCGINIRGRSRKLRINYRTTEEIRRWSVALLEGREIDDLDGGPDDNSGYQSLTHGEPPEMSGAACYEEEIRQVVAHVHELTDRGVDLRNCCLVARTRDQRDMYQQSLEAAGIECYRIESKTSDRNAIPGIRVATMHRVKGLEFDYVIIAGVNDGKVPLYHAGVDNADNAFAVAEHETRERSLLYVAATRAKRDVLITWHGRASRFFGQ